MAEVSHDVRDVMSSKPVPAFVKADAMTLYDMYLKWVEAGRPTVAKREPAKVVAATNV